MISEAAYRWTARVISEYLFEHGPTPSDVACREKNLAPSDFLPVVARMLHEKVLDGYSYEPFLIWLPGQNPPAAETYITRASQFLAEELQANELSGEDPELLRILVVLVLIRGMDVSSEDVHNALATWRTAAHPGHGPIVPFHNLDEDQKKANGPYALAIFNTALRLMEEGGKR